MSFDTVAPVYALIERLVYGRALQQARTALLPNIAEPRRALLIGDGDGRFSAELLQHFPSLQVDIVEPSVVMTRLARKRCGAEASRVQWHNVPIQSFEPGERAWDLVVTQFVLDVLEQHEVEQLVSKLGHSCGQWLVAEFQPGVFDLLLRIMYQFFRTVAGLQVNRIPEYRRALESGGWQWLAEATFWRGFIRAELYGRSSPGRRISLVT